MDDLAMDVPALDGWQTRWLDLRDKGDRRKAIRNISALSVLAELVVKGDV